MPAYTPTVWVNNVPPPLSAANLNKLTDEIRVLAAAASPAIPNLLPTWVDGSAPALTDAAPLNEIERVVGVLASRAGVVYTPTVWQAGWYPSRSARNLNNIEAAVAAISVAGGASTWDSALQAAFPRPAFTPTRTVTASNQAQLDSAVANLQAGDLVQCIGTWTYSGGLTIQKQLASVAEIHFDGISFVCPGSHTKLQCVWVNNCQKIRMYGGTVTSSSGFGIRVYGGTDITWQDFVLNNCEATGVHLNTGAGAGSNMIRPTFKGETHNCGWYYANDGHPEPGTGWHGCYVGSGDGVYTASGGKIALDVYDQPAGAAIEVNECNNSEFWIRANRLTFMAQQQTAGNVVQSWGATQSNNTYHWIEGHDITGHGYMAINTLTGCVVNYGRCTNYSTNPRSSDWAWGTSGGMVYQDVQPQTFGAGD